MAIWNLGSINADHVYRVPHILAPGETLSAQGLTTGLGGKGTNMSVAAARAAARVHHIGAVGEDGRWAVDRLMEYGVDTRHIGIVTGPTGQAIIAVGDDGENTIILLSGANRAIELSALQGALSGAATGDIFLTQNETNLQTEAASLARQMGLRVAYAAAPFDAGAVRAILPHVDLLFLNEVEARQLAEATGHRPSALPVADVIVTMGAQGCLHYDTRNQSERHYPALKVDAVDTTGAGDTFTGYVLAGLDRGMPMGQAIGQAQRAAALMVMRHGAADVIPDLSEVQAFRD